MSDLADDLCFRWTEEILAEAAKGRLTRELVVHIVNGAFVVGEQAGRESAADALASLREALERIQRGYDEGIPESFSGSMCSEIAAEALGVRGKR